MPQMDTVLVIEDHDPTQTLIKEALQDSFDVVVCDAVEPAIQQKKTSGCEIVKAVILDLALPGISGVQAVKTVKKTFPSCKIVVLTAHHDIETKVAVLSMGVDDYVVKPFDPIELETRVKLRLGHFFPAQIHVQTLWNTTLNPSTMSLQIHSEEGEISQPLSSTEFRILQLFLAHPEQLVSREKLLQTVWGDLAVSNRTVDTTISRLRQKLSPSEILFKSIYGKGYRCSRKTFGKNKDL